MEKLVLATRNSHKIQEISKFFSDVDVQILSIGDFQDAPYVVESGKTLEENAIIKAESASKFTGLPALADDTGLFVEALNGAPGVYSSRYAQEGNYKLNNQKLLKALEGVPFERRTAYFKTVVVLVLPDMSRYIVSGRLNGKIIDKLKGTHGFGYDPLFYVEDKGRTLAELTLEEKNKISHRAKAFENIKPIVVAKILQFTKKA